MTVEEELLAALKAHECASVDDLFDSLPADQVKCLIAGLGRKAVRIEQLVQERKRAKLKAGDRTAENLAEISG